MMKQMKCFKKYMSIFRRFYIIAAIVVIVGFIGAAMTVYNHEKQEFEAEREIQQGYLEEFSAEEMSARIKELSKNPDYTDEDLVWLLKEYNFMMKHRDTLMKLNCGFMNYYLDIDEIDEIVKSPSDEIPLQANNLVKKYEKMGYVTNASVPFEKTWYHYELMFSCLTIMLFLIAQSIKQSQKRSREFLGQLPFSKMQWFFVEGISGWCVTVGVTMLCSLILSLCFFGKGLVGTRLLMDTLYIMIYSSMVYAFIIMAKEFVANTLAGIVLGCTVFWLGLYDLGGLDSFNINGLGVYQMITPVTAIILMLFCLFIGAIQSRKKDESSNHFIPNLVVRLLVVASFMIIPVCSLFLKFSIGKIGVLFGYILVGSSLYILLDLKFISQQLERFVVQYKGRK